MQIHELRLTRRLLNYWHLIRKSKPIPDIRYFNSASLEDVWPFCVKLAFEQKPGAYRYEHMGDGIKRIYGDDLTGLVVEANSATKLFPGTSIFQKMRSMEGGTPVEDEGHFLKVDGSVVKYRACLLPFGDASGLTHVIIGFSCRDFR